MDTENTQIIDRLDKIEKMIIKMGKMVAALSKATEDAANAQRKLPFIRPFEMWRTFNWESIGARVAATDDDGVSMVEWNRDMYTRRSGSGKFGNAVWYSRSTGMSESGAEYEVLIRFRQMMVEQLDRRLGAS
jgi:hypothetical protein